jgi:hypothetical protein
MAAVAFAVGASAMPGDTDVHHVRHAQPRATFGGTGIPNNAVAASQHQRADARPDGAQALRQPGARQQRRGVFSAQAGRRQPPAVRPRIRTPCGTSVSTLGARTRAGTTYRLLYDFDPLADTEESAHGRGDALPAGAVPDGSTAQDSWNLGMKLPRRELGEHLRHARSRASTGVGRRVHVRAHRSTTARRRSPPLAIEVDVTPCRNRLPVALVGVALLGLAGARRRRAEAVVAKSLEARRAPGFLFAGSTSAGGCPAALNGACSTSRADFARHVSCETSPREPVVSGLAISRASAVLIRASVGAEWFMPTPSAAGHGPKVDESSDGPGT